MVRMGVYFVFDTWRGILQKFRDVITDTIFLFVFGGNWKNRISSKTSRVCMR